MSNTHKHEEDWYGNCYECGLNLLKPQANTLDEIVLGIIERTESYRQNNDMSILESGDLTKWFIPEEVEKLKALITEENRKGYTEGVIDNFIDKDRLITEARIDELKQILDSESCICDEVGVKECDKNWSLCNVARDRLTQLKENN